MKLPALLRPIRVRLTLWYVLLLAIVLSVFGGAVYLALGWNRYSDLDDILRSSAALLAGAVEAETQGPLSSWSGPEQDEHVWRALAP